MTEINDSTAFQPIPSHPRFRNLTGLSFNRWTVLGYLGSSTWFCRCECGKTANVATDNLTTARSKSCGCFRVGNDFRTTHGMSGTPTYKIWVGMKNRCQNPNADSYPKYGKRGITVCDRWQTFENFYADMGPRPSHKHSIERLNNKLGYSPDNCVWTTVERQMSNTSRNVYITHAGKRQTLSAWSRETGIPHVTIRHRLAHGWSVERALTK